MGQKDQGSDKVNLASESALIYSVVSFCMCTAHRIWSAILTWYETSTGDISPTDSDHGSC